MWSLAPSERETEVVSTVCVVEYYYANEAETEPSRTHPQCLDPSLLGAAGRPLLVILVLV